jgi:hypothetical protein
MCAGTLGHKGQAGEGIEDEKVTLWKGCQDVLILAEVECKV